MLSLVIIDDEPRVLNGLTNLIAWQDIGFTSVVSFDDSVEALAYITQNKPDAVLTDIRMPEYSGLDLIQKTREMGIRSEFVIISGFAEFEFARQALRHEVYEYLLKPVSTKELVDTMSRLVIKIMGEKNKMDMEKFLSVLAGNNKSADTWFKKWGMNGLPFRVLCTGFQGIFGYLGGNGYKTVSFDSSDGIYYIIAAGDSEKLSGLERISENQIICMSEIETESSELGSAVLSAIDAYNASFFMNGKINISTKQKDLGIKKGKQIREMCKEGNIRGALLELSLLPECARKERWSLKDAVECANRIREGINPDHDSLLTIQNIELKYCTFSELCEALYQTIQEEHATSELLLKDSTAASFYNLVHDIDTLYTKKIKLSELSEKYNLSFGYASKLFGKIKGCTFNEYITKKRLEKAQALLIEGNTHLSQIAAMCGYTDYYYFLRAFKMFFGDTPTRYREKREANNAGQV